MQQILPEVFGGLIFEPKNTQKLSPTKPSESAESSEESDADRTNDMTGDAVIGALGGGDNLKVHDKISINSPQAQSPEESSHTNADRTNDMTGDTVIGALGGGDNLKVHDKISINSPQAQSPEQAEQQSEVSGMLTSGEVSDSGSSLYYAPQQSTKAGRKFILPCFWR